MIHEVDAALLALIERGRSRPTTSRLLRRARPRTGPGRRNAPTIDVYLYDIREDLRRRRRRLPQRSTTTADRGASPASPCFVVPPGDGVDPAPRGRAPPALVPARLLPAARLHPRDLLTGPVADIGLSVPMAIALPRPGTAPSPTWTALGGEAEPSLDVVVSAPTWTGRVYPAAPLVRRPVRCRWRRRRLARRRSRAGGVAPSHPGGRAAGPHVRPDPPPQARPQGAGSGRSDRGVDDELLTRLLDVRARVPARGRPPRAGDPPDDLPGLYVDETVQLGCSAGPPPPDLGPRAAARRRRGPADDAGPARQTHRARRLLVTALLPDSTAASREEEALRLPERRRHAPAREHRAGARAGGCRGRLRGGAARPLPAAHARRARPGAGRDPDRPLP